MSVMRRVVDQAMVLVPAAAGAVVELVSGDELAYACAAGNLSQHVGTRLQVDGSLSGLSVRLNRILLCEDAETDDRVDRDACRRVGARSMICVPLHHGGRAIGALKVSAPEPHVFGDSDVAALAQLATFISVTISAAADIAQASHDALAGEGSDGLHSGTVFIADVLQAGTSAVLASRERVQDALDRRAFTVVAQPIVELRTGEALGMEALSRFTAEPVRSPDWWFAEAQQVGLGAELELATAAEALTNLPQLPEGMFISVNAGPDTVLAPRLQALLELSGPDRIVLELTEHASIEDYPLLRDRLDDVRAAGARVAVDDSGAGFSGLAHIYNLAPDVIKLDRRVTAGLDRDPVRRALAAALAAFARDTNAILLAEGIETHDQLEAARDLGVLWGQGYLFGKPSDLYWRSPLAADLTAA